MRRYPAPGTILLGKYRVLSLIGEGGMGAVLKARHIDLDEDVAIKCLLPHHLEREDIVRRFLREAKAAVKLKGKHVARVLDVGRLETGVPYIVMEYLEGADLNAIVKHHGAQDPAVAVDLMLQACEAIAEAHAIGIIHRDIKASNFFVSQRDNQAPHLKVLDFGIATAPEGTSDLTNTQSVIGTPAYMAPEQMRSSKTSDARSDIWSLGVVLYELLEGARPFRSDVYSELCLKVGMDPPLPITNPAVPAALIPVVMRCLEKPIEARYQSVAELAFDLMPFASDPVFARASAEQSARLLGRRSYGAPVPSAQHTGPITPISQNDLSDVRTQMTPGSLTPGSLTPGSLTPANPAPPPSMPTLLGRPTPMPSSAPRTPTSIQASAGQLAQLDAPKSRGRGLLIGLVAMSVIAIGAVAMFVIDRQGSHASEPTPAVAPATPTAPPKADPVLGDPADHPAPAAGSADIEKRATDTATTTTPDPNNTTPPDTTTKPKDPVAVKKDPVVVKKDPVAVKKDPVAVKKDPVKKDPVAVKPPVKKDPVKKDPVKKDTVTKPGDEDMYGKRE